MTTVKPYFALCRIYVALFIYFALVPLAGWVTWNVRPLIGKHPLPIPSTALFRKINIYLFLIMSLLSLDGALPWMP